MSIRTGIAGSTLLGSFATLAVLAVLLSSGSAPAQSDRVEEAAAPTTVFLLRHAEKGTDDARDPGLSERGERRAESLAALLEHAGVTHVFASEYRRTQATLAPLAKAIGFEVTVVSARSPAEQVKALRALPSGSVAVVAGHSNTTPSLVRALGGVAERLVDSAHGPVLGEDEYGRLFVVTLPPPDCEARVKSLELAYGGR